MPGPTNSTNRFGSSSYIVGTPANGLGNGVNFTSIQAAINQALADGYGVLNPVDIIIRAGVYTEDVTINDGGIHLVGAGDGAYNLLTMPTLINGSLTLNITGANNFTVSNLAFSNPNPAPAVSVTGGVNPARISFTNCFFSTTGGGFPAVSFTNTSGTFGFANFINCYLIGDSVGHYSSARTVSAFVTSQVSGATNGIELDGTARVQVFQSAIQAQNGIGILHTAASNQSVIRFSAVTASDAALDMALGGTANIRESIMDSDAPSGFFIQGTGTFEYCDVINEGLSRDIDPAIGVITIPDWKPYAEAGAAPGTGVVKGTCCFDSSQFNVVDGFVQYTGSSGFQWVEQNSSVTVNPNEGNFSVANITLTLPAQPQPMGTTVKFKVVTNDTLVIAGNVGDVLQLGNQSGTTITSTASGDAIELTHYDLGIWIANASIGNFIVA